jgi:hypothetical protein
LGLDRRPIADILRTISVDSVSSVVRFAAIQYDFPAPGGPHMIVNVTSRRVIS